VQVYKTYEDVNGDILEVGDTIKVTTTILPTHTTRYTYLEDTKWIGNTEIQTDEGTNKFTSFQFASDTHTGNIKIDRNLDIDNDFMIETTHSNQDRITFSYEMVYLWWESSTQIKIKDAEILSGDVPYHYRIHVSNNGVVTTGATTTKAKDGLPDIIVYPNNACLKYSIIMRNTNQWIYPSTYEDIFFDMKAQMDKKASETQAATDASLSGTMSSLFDTGTDIQDMQWMDQLFENRSASSVFNASTQWWGV